MRLKDIVAAESPITEVSVPTHLLPQRFFHGSRPQYVKSILAHGLYPQDFVAYGRRNTALRPVDGQVYMTPDATAAAQYGSYLFVIYPESITNELQPDEDEVGDIFHWIIQAEFTDLERTRRVHKDSPDHVARMELLNDPSMTGMVERFERFMMEVVPAKTRERMAGGDMMWLARGGKAALKKMPDDIKLWLITKVGVHVSHRGPIMPDELWALRPQREALLPNGSNLDKVADRIDMDKAAFTPMPPKGPPQNFKVTFEYNANWNRPKMAAKLVRRSETFIAPTEDEARIAAEVAVVDHGKASGYRIVAIDRI